MPRHITQHTLRAAALACALAAPTALHAAPAENAPRSVASATDNVITNVSDPVSVFDLNLRASGRVRGGMGSVSERLGGDSGANQLAMPATGASLASALSMSSRLAQNIPDGPAAAPREQPKGLETPVGPEEKKPLPVPAPLPATPPAETPAAPVAPAAGTPVTPPAPAPANPDDIAKADAEGRPIANVRVVGNRVVTESSILLQATTQRGGAYSARQIELDRAKIDALGFFASVQSQVTPNLEDTTKVDVTFIVVENRVVKGFQFEGNKALTTEGLTKVVTSKPGNVLNRNTVNADIEAIQALYKEKGFAGIVTETRQTEDGTLIFVIQEGTISKVVFSGQKKTSEFILRKQIRTKPGDPFDQAKLRLDLNRLYDTGFFDDVSYRVSDDADKPGSIIITIQLKEKRTGQLSLGVGFDNRSKITGFVSVADTNFRGTGKRVNAGVEIGSRRTFELGYGNPFVGKKNASYDFSLFDRIIFREPQSVAAVAPGLPTDTTQFSYEEKRTGGRFNYTQPLDEDRNKNILFGIRAEKARLFQVDTSGNSVPVNLPTNASGRVVAPSIGFLRDNRDLRLDPSKGGREQITVEQALKFIGSSSSFTKLDLDLRRYFPLVGARKEGDLPKLVLAGRLVAGKAFGQLPAFEQYFIGGSDTVRGYDTDSQFGDNQVFSNVELRYRLQRKFQIVGFFDAGRASGGNFSSADSQLLYSFGAGIRVQTPIGPLRLDVGHGRDGVRTHFGIGPTF